MFTAVPDFFPYRDPWIISYEDRLRAMCASDLRVAYFYEQPDTSTFRYRAFNPGLSLAAAESGVAASWFCHADFIRNDAFIRRADLLVICRARFNAAVAHLIAVARAEGVPILFDCDDLVFDPDRVHMFMDSLARDPLSETEWDHWSAYIGRLGSTFRQADGFVTTNEYLLARAREIRPGLPGMVMRNYLNPDQQAVSDRVFQAKATSGWERTSEIHIGYFSGSPSHARDFGLVAPAISALMDEDPRIVLRTVGFLDPDGSLARHRDRIEVFPLQDFLNLQRLVGEVEINVACLAESSFTNCKSELKFFEAAAVGTITVATPTVPYAAAIDHGRTGLLAPAHGWLATLREAVAIVDDETRYRAISTAAREYVLDVYGWERQGAAIEEGLTHAVGFRQRKSSVRRDGPGTALRRETR